MCWTQEVPRAYREVLAALVFLEPWGSTNPNTHGHVRVGACRLQPLTSSLYARQAYVAIARCSPKAKIQKLAFCGTKSYITTAS
jgi:hypothetical protein